MRYSGRLPHRFLPTHFLFGSIFTTFGSHQRKFRRIDQIPTIKCGLNENIQNARKIYSFILCKFVLAVSINKHFPFHRSQIHARILFGRNEIPTNIERLLQSLQNYLRRESNWTATCSRLRVSDVLGPAHFRAVRKY